MIPYEELVVALQTWRARQGLPVMQLSGALTPPPPPPAPSMSRPAPSAPPPPPRAAAMAPPPLEAPTEDSLLDVEDAALLEENHYENEGDNFTMKFGAHEVEHDVESTSVAGDVEERLTDPHLGGGATRVETEVLPEPKGPPGRAGNRNDDW